jgi:hypothetical protein
MRGDGLNEISLAALLARWGVHPEVIQIGKGRKDRQRGRGYKVADLRAAYKRSDRQRGRGYKVPDLRAAYKRSTEG